jgi:hypothetical protein
VLTLENDNFTPPSRTPWGGHEILRQLKGARRKHGQGDIPVVGESWEISGHASFPSKVIVYVDNKKVAVPITKLEELDAVSLYGKKNVEHFNGSMPILVKFLNSGGWKSLRSRLADVLHGVADVLLSEEWTEALGVSMLSRLLDGNNDALHRGLASLKGFLNDASCPKELIAIASDIESLHTEMLTRNLSVQVHPNKDDFDGLPSKTEAWVILDAGDDKANAQGYIGWRKRCIGTP